MKLHQLSAEDAIASVQSTPRGLSPVEAERRLREHGPNVVQEFARESPWLRFAAGNSFSSFPSSCGLPPGLRSWPSGATPARAWRKSATPSWSVILVSGVFSFWQEYRVEQTLAALRKLLPQKVKLMRDGKVILGCRRASGARRHRRARAGRQHPCGLPADRGVRRAGQQRRGHRRIGAAGARRGAVRRR